jgi:hypothetical protein
MLSKKHRMLECLRAYFRVARERSQFHPFLKNSSVVAKEISRRSKSLDVCATKPL